MIEKRRGIRYGIPDIFREYITFKVIRDSGKLITMKLLDFSSNGIRFKSPYGVSVDLAMECLISLPQSLKKEVPFIVKIKYCNQNEPDEDYLIGAEIIETSDKVWFDVFSNVHEFIKKNR